MIPIDCDNLHLHIVIHRATTKSIQAIDSKMLLNKDETLNICSNNTGKEIRNRSKERYKKKAENKLELSMMQI